MWIGTLFAVAIAAPIVGVVWATEPSRKFWKEQRRRWREAATRRANQFDGNF